MNQIKQNPKHNDNPTHSPYLFLSSHELGDNNAIMGCRPKSAMDYDNKSVLFYKAFVKKLFLSFSFFWGHLFKLFSISYT